eukprot:1227016-Amphidinium_carterae.1
MMTQVVAGVPNFLGRLQMAYRAYLEAYDSGYEVSSVLLARRAFGIGFCLSAALACAAGVAILREVQNMYCSYHALQAHAHSISLHVQPNLFFALSE